MQDLAEIFDAYDFIRCHQGYIVPLYSIKSLQKDAIGRSYWLTLQGIDISIPLSRRKYSEIKDVFQQHGIHCY